MTYNEQYYKYLGKISWKGKFFRQRIVYPNIHSWATGHTLDIGCGLGLFLKTDSNAIGVDINEFCVQHCHNIMPGRVKLMQEDILPFSDRTFNSVVLDNVIEHIYDPVPLLNETKRVLKKPGNIIVLVPGIKGFARDNDHKVFYDFNKINELAKELKLEIVKQKSLPVPFLSRYLSAFCYFNVLRCQ